MVFGFLTRKATAEDANNIEEGETQSPAPSAPPKSPSPAPEPKPEQSQATPQGPRDIQSLYKLVKSIPSKVLHDYTIARLRSQDDETDLSAILAFFSDLQPPILLHCVRCHKNYFEVENTDRSCQIEHDDDSAEIERVGGEYETLYSCCNQTVEGEGDMGPPDGWCYEGEHTTDRVRARYRADSTLRNPKLVACTKRCHPVSASASGARKRRRAQESESDDQDEEEQDSSMEEITRAKPSSKGKEKAPRSAPSPGKRIPKKVKTLKNGHVDPDNIMSGAESGASASPKKPTTPKQRKPRKKKEPTESMDVDSEPNSGKKPPTTRSPGKEEHTDTDIEPKIAKVTPRSRAKAKHKTTGPESLQAPKSSTKSDAKLPSTIKPRQTAKKGKSLKEVVSTSVDGEV